MQVSVALAAHNNEDHLDALLESLVRQTHPPSELVVTDDASEDATPRLLEEFAARAPFPVRIERFAQNRGFVEAFIAAARRCRGDAVAFCDADDVWLEHKLETCVRELEGSGATLAMHPTRVVDAELRDLGRVWPAIRATRSVPPLRLAGLEVHAPGMAMVFRRDVLAAAPFDERPPSRYGGERMLHDEWVFFLAGALGPIRLVAEPLVLYRQHGSNASAGSLDGARPRSLRPALGNYRRARDHTEACAAYLEAAGDERLRAAGRAYRRMAENWELRASLYGASGRRARARRLRRLVAAHAYADRERGGFGRAALAKDVAAALVLGVPPAPS